MNIPLRYKEGKYNYNDISADTVETLKLSLNDYNILSYNHPKAGNEILLYNVNCTPLQNYLYATYNESGMLKYVEIINGDDVRLVYIGYTDDDDARAEMLDFAEQSADIIAEEILSRKGKFSRLFIEYYKWFDFGIKLVNPEEQQAVIDNLPEKKKTPEFIEYIKNSSGEYSSANRINCDNATIEVMLSCSSEWKISNELGEMAVKVMTDNITNAVIDKIDKTDDFRVIAEEYD